MGADAVIITASSKDSSLVQTAGEISKQKGRVVIVGLVGMDIPRDLYYKKELDVRLSMSYGPGRYDPQYEEEGIDYPFAYVRWTEQRNFEAFLDMVKMGSICPSKLVTHTYNFEDALKAYDLIGSKTVESYIGILLKYKQASLEESFKRIVLSHTYVPSSKLRAGFIGAGNFTKAVLLPNIKKIGAFSLESVCTSTGVSAHAACKKYGFRIMTTSVDKLIKNPDINTVFITTPHNTHALYILKALEENKHVFVEKPLCIHENELQEIQEKINALSKENHLPILQVGYNRRFVPLLRLMKDTCKDVPVMINYRINAGVIPISHWIQNNEIGGGRIIGEVCHFVDTCIFLAGSMPVKVYASTAIAHDRTIPDADNVSIIINFSNGSIATITYYAFGNKSLPKESIELFAFGKAMQLDDFKKLKIYKGNNKKTVSKFNQDKGFSNELKAFETAVKTGVPAIPLDEVFAVSKTTFCILESIKTGKPVLI
jgi:predicted dehydrogenase